MSHPMAPTNHLASSLPAVTSHMWTALSAAELTPYLHAARPSPSVLTEFPDLLPGRDVINPELARAPTADRQQLLALGHEGHPSPSEDVQGLARADVPDPGHVAEPARDEEAAVG